MKRFLEQINRQTFHIFQQAWAFLANDRLVSLTRPEKLFLVLAIPFGVIMRYKD